MNGDSLGDRMKAFEDCYRFKIPRKSHVIVRVDGRAFHSISGLAKPFDAELSIAMSAAALKTADDMQGFRLGYHQSDEVSFYLTDKTENPMSEAWFDNNLAKLVSVTASLFTRHFRTFYDRPQTFDARAFVLPEEELPNYFLWRIRDWNRNSLSMFARAHFSARDLHGRATTEVHQMLHGIGRNWSAELADSWKNGDWIFRDRIGEVTLADIGYEPLRALIVSTLPSPVTP